MLITGHAAGIVAAAVSPDGYILATGSFDHSVILWDLASREMLRPPLPHDYPGRLRFSPEGSRLAAWGNGQLTVWEVATGGAQTPMPDYECFFLDFEDEHRLLVAQPRKKDGTLWIGIHDLETGEFLPWWDTAWNELQELGNWTNSLLRSEDRSLIAGFTENEIRLWEAESGTLLGTHAVPPVLRLSDELPETSVLRGPTTYQTSVRQLALAPEAQRVAVASNHALWLMDRDTGRRTRLLACGDSPEAVAIAPDGRTLASGHAGGGLVVWSLPNGDLIREIRAHRSRLNAVAFAPDSRCLVSVSDSREIKHWNTASGGCRRLPTADAAVEGIAFSPDGTLLASAHQDGAVRLWNVEKGSLVNTRGRSSGGVDAVAFAGDGRNLVSTRRDTRNPHSRCWVDHWAVEPGDCLRTFRTVQYPTWSLAVSPDAEYLVHSTLGETQVWLLQDRELHYELKADVAAISPNGRVLATGFGDNGQGRLWDLATGALLEKLELPPVNDRLASLRFSPDGKTLYAGTDGFAVIRWNLATGRVAWSRRMDRDHLSALDVAPDGTRFAVASAYSRRAWVRELPKGTRGPVLRGHRGPVSAVAFSPDGALLASGSEDATVKLWDPATGEVRKTLSVLPGDGSEPSEDWICHTPEGEYHGSPGAERFVRWAVNGEFVPVEVHGKATC